MFSHLLGIRPWEWDALSYRDTRTLMRWCDEYKTQIEEANRQ